MEFKNTRLQLILRIGLIVLFAFTACWLFVRLQVWYAGSFFVLLVVLQVFEIIHYLEKPQRDILNLLGFIQYDDFTVTHTTQKQWGVTKQLYEEYNKVIKKFRELRAEKESNLHFFRSILQHVDIGIVALKKSGEVKTINTSALRLLNLQNMEHIDQISQSLPEIQQVFTTLPSHRKTVLKLQRQSESITLSISALDLVIYGEELKLVTFSNIQAELEDKEMEAWQNMTRVMMHEIMNSLTPITSLAATVSDDMLAWKKLESPTCVLPSNVEDMYLSIATIKKRSEGLMRFVEDFRHLSQIPKPKPELFKLKGFFDHLSLLMRPTIEKHNATLSVHLEPESMQLMADFLLTEQIFINLITNALEALTLVDHPRKIEIHAFYTQESKIEIHVRDNGPGIEKEVLEKVFIPFYSTKKTGSGIGLSISKQIMRMHNGTLKLQSEKGKGTVARVVF